MNKSGAGEGRTASVEGAGASTFERTGVLRGEAVLTLQTRHAQRLVKGRAGSAARARIVGLLTFATLVRIVWRRAGQGDPYAEWWLVKVDAALARGERAAMESQAALDRRLASVEALQVSRPASVKPARVAASIREPLRVPGRAPGGAVRRTGQNRAVRAPHRGLVGRGGRS